MTRFTAVEICLLAGWLCVPSCPAVRGEDGKWGDLTFRVSYDGVPPITQPIEIEVEKDVFTTIENESLLISAKDSGIANVVVWLVPNKGQSVPIHTSLAKAKSESVVTIKDFRCEPHVVITPPPQLLTLRNQDGYGVAPRLDFVAAGNPLNSSLIPVGGDITIRIGEDEQLPVRMSCVIHPWLQSWIVARSNPYVAVSDTSGKIAIKNLPVGKWNFRLRHERAGFIKTGALDGKAFDWPKGRMPPLDIKAGKNDLGELKLKPEVFK